MQAVLPSPTDQQRTFCDFRGQPLTSWHWRLEVDGRVLRHCGPERAEMTAALAARPGSA